MRVASLFVRCSATICVYQLCRNMCRAPSKIFANVRFAYRVSVVGIGHLEIMGLSHASTVPDPGANDMQGKALGQFRFPRRPHVVPRPLPRCQSGLADDPYKLSPQIRPAVTIAGNDEAVADLVRVVEIE